MNDLIDTMVLEAKLLNWWAIKWYAYCVDKLNTRDYRAKNSLAPTSGRFLSKFLQTLRAMSWTCPRVSFWLTSITLSNRCLKLFDQWRPCFLRYANFLTYFVPLGQRYCIPNFKLIGPTVYALQFFQSYSATKWQSCAIFFIWPKNS